jgi:hypothetical protein
MMSVKPSNISQVMFSVRMYQLLLHAYPAKFRQDYGPHMAQVFQDCCLRMVRQGGANGMARLWVVTLLDLAQSVISEHAHKEIEMKKEMKPEDIRMAGWALIMGAVTFAIGMLSQLIGGPDFWTIGTALVILLSLPLLVIGLLGVRSRYGDNVGGFGRNILLAGAILGPLTCLITFVGGVTQLVREDLGWILLYVGLAVLLACLALFGIVALYKRPLPRWNVVPVIAGVWYPILIFYWFVPLVSPGAWEGRLNIPDSVSIILLTIQSIALAALGYILRSDVPEEAAATA